MSDRTAPSLHEVEWARHVNGRWLVGETLRKDAADYLDYLSKVDPARLVESCRRARRLFDHRRPGEDPKPWFYPGLFSLATLPEARRYLRGHDFTIACIPALRGYGLGALQSDIVRPDTADKLRRVRAALAGLREEGATPG